jgi:hypothetical protein
MTQAPDAAGSADRPNSESLTGDDQPGIELTAADPDPDPEDAPSAYEGTEILPPPVFTSGRYQFPGSPSASRPPDPVVPFVAPPVSRRRRSDWPVLVVALVISSIVLAGCCIAGYALYASKSISF